MTNFNLVLELIGLIAISMVVLYFLVWRDRSPRAERRPPPMAEPKALAQARR